MDVTLSGNNALCKLNLTAGTYKLAAGGSCNISAFTNRSRNSERSCIGKRNLNLCSGTSRSEDADLFDRLLGADDGNSLLTGKLTRLAQILLVCKSSALSEKDLYLLLCYMNVSCGCLNENFV